MHSLKRTMPAILKLTTDMIKKICELLREGMLPRFAAMEADISLRSYHRWRGEGKKFFEKRDKGENPEDAEDDMMMQFYIETEKALGAYDKTLGIEYAKHIQKSWQTIAWIRQHRFPNDYRESAVDGDGEDEDDKSDGNGDAKETQKKKVETAKKNIMEAIPTLNTLN